jgi:excisionase family DNA binding protein
MTTAAPERTFLTVQEAASEMRSSQLTIYRRIREGSLRAHRTGGPTSPLRIDRADLEAWLEANRATVVVSADERAAAGPAGTSPSPPVPQAREGDTT